MLVNLEDHLQLIMLPENAGQLQNSFIKFAKLVKAFEKLDFAQDSYLGNLTVSPKHLGTALHLQAKFNTIKSLND